MKSKELRAVIITLVFGMAVLGSVIAVKTYLDYRSSLTAVTFTYNTVENATVSLFKGAKKDLVEPVTQGEGRVIESGKSYELEDWPYVIVINGSERAMWKPLSTPFRRCARTSSGSRSW